MQYTYTIRYNNDGEVNSITWNYLCKQITYNVLDAREFIQFSKNITTGSQEHTTETQTQLSYTLDIQTPLTKEQRGKLDRLCANPDLWIPLTFGGRRFMDTFQAEEITKQLRAAVPNKGLTYYGDHGEIGYIWADGQTLTEEELRAADEAWMRCFYTT